MKIISHQSVEKFIKHLDFDSASEMLRVVELLETYGHKLSMPHAKPIGNGLWELRIVSKRSLRVLYGFCGKEAVLVVALKKKKVSLLQREVKIAKKRLDEYCAS